MKDSFLFRCCLITLIVMGITAPLLVHGTFQGAQAMRNAPIRWIPETFPERKAFSWFVDCFHTPEYIIISWPGCTVDDERLKRFEEILSDVKNERAQQLFHQVLTGYSVLRQLVDAPLNLKRKLAQKRLRGTLVGADGSTSCAVLALTEQGADQNRQTQEYILDVVERELGVPRSDCYLAGSPIDGVAIDSSSAQSIRTFMIPSTLVVLLLCRWCLRSWTLTSAIIVTALFGEALVLSLVYFSGVTMNAVLTVMAPLVFVLTVSAGVHLVNYYHDEVRLRGQLGAARRALSTGWAPCVLAAVTTAIGLCSLVVSYIVPVKHFGIFASIGLVSTTALLFLVLPGPMVWRPNLSRRRSSGDRFAANGRWQTMARMVQRAAPALSVVCLGGMILSVFGLARLESSVKVLNLLVPESRTVRDYTWLEENVGPMVPIEIVLNFDAACRLNLLQRIELVRWVQRELDRMDKLDGTMSAATFFPTIPAPGGVRRTAQRRVLRRRLTAQQENLIDAHYLKGTVGEQQSWRISARAPALGSLDYGIFLDQLRKQIDPALSAYAKHGKGEISATYTGIMPLVYHVQRMMLSDLIRSYLTALVSVAVIMMVVLRSVSAGVVAMLPNMFPTFILFGAMGGLGIPVDIGSMMTASVALGIAVDGTLHFLNWFRREIHRGCSREEAVQNTFQHCARAILQTTVICGVGLMVYAFSDFVPTRRFAFLMCSLLIAACVGDLLLLPALLIGPLGRLFVRKQRLTKIGGNGLSQAA